MNIDLEGFEGEQTKDLLVVVLDNQGRIIFVNKAMEQFTGRSFKNLKELRVWDLFAVDEESNSIEENFINFNNELFPKKLKGKMLSKEGTGKDVKWTNNILLNRDDQIDRVICFGKILSENDEYEYEETFPREIIKEQPDKTSYKNCFLITNDKGKILDISDSYCELTGYSRQELLRMTLHEMDGNTNTSELHIKIQKTINKGHDDFRFIQKLSNGDLLNLQVSANYSHNFGGLVFFSINNSHETEQQPPMDQNKPEFRQYLRAQILDKIDELIFIHDFNGNLIYVNETASKLFGYSKKELFEIKFNELFFPDKPGAYENMLKQLVDEDEVYMETKYTRKEGDSADVCLRSQIMSVSNRKLILSVIKTNDKVAVDQNDLNKVINNIDEAFIIMDKDSNIISCNDLFCNLCGYEIDEITGTSFEDLLITGSTAKFKNYVDSCKRGNPQHLLALLKNKNGKKINIDIAAKYASDESNTFYTLVHNMTKQKVLADGYKNSLQINRLLSTRIDNIVYRVLVHPKIKFEYISDSVYNMLGYQAQEFYEKPEMFLKICHPEDKKYIESMMNKCDETKHILRFIHKDGSVVRFEVDNSLIYDASKKLIGCEGSARDITLMHSIRVELDNRSEYMDAITQNLDIGVAVISKDYNIVWLNNIARQLFPKCANKKCYEAFHNSGNICSSCSFSNGTSDGQNKRIINITTGENKALSKQYEMLTVPVHSKNGQTNQRIELFVPVRINVSNREDAQENDSEHTKKPGENHFAETSSSVLCEMNELLRSCVNIREANRIISRYLPRLFPALSGAMFIYKSSVNLFELMVSWGNDIHSSTVFPPEACTAIRRAKKILSDNEDREETCEHIDKEAALDYVEIPMICQGDRVGLLHIQNNSKAEETAEKNNGTLNDKVILLAQVVADQIAIVLTSIKLREIIQEQAKHDPVTGLFNRKYMEQALEREIRLANGSGKQVGIILLSLENFNEFVESRVYQNGDSVLQNFGIVLKNGCAAEDIICRHDSNKFAIVVPNSSPEHTRGKALALTEIAKFINISDKQSSSVPLHLSLGIAVYPDHGASSADLIKSVYSSLYTNRKKFDALKEHNAGNIREPVKQR